MIINEMSGSGGDALPWYFRKAGIGPLIGQSTWGGLVGIGGYPELMDGGLVTAPRVAILGLKASGKSKTTASRRTWKSKWIPPHGERPRSALEKGRRGR